MKNLKIADDLHRQLRILAARSGNTVFVQADVVIREHPEIRAALLSEAKSAAKKGK